MAKQQIFLENILNQYDSYTYNWSIHMLHPNNVHRFEENIASNNVKTLAHSGVETEINIQSVEQVLNLAFKGANNQDRTGLANMFGITFIEPGGTTFFTRILKAARDLDIENHLQACYLLELKFLGYNEDGRAVQIPIGPFYYMCTLINLSFNYNDGSTIYVGDFLETHQDAYKTQLLHIKSKIDNIQASTFGEFITKLEETVQKQEDYDAYNSVSRELANTYKLKCKEQAWLDAEFGTAAGSGAFRNISVSGDGKLNFSIPQGTSVSDAMVCALLQTKYFRKIPTISGAFHKDNPNDAIAKAKSFEEISSWFIFDNTVSYGTYDTRAKVYSKTIVYDMYKFAVPEVVHDADSFQEMIKDSNLQSKRLKNIVENGLLRKRFDFTYTGLNTEVLGFDVQLNNTYYVLQGLHQGIVSERSSSLGDETGLNAELNKSKTEAATIKKQIDANNSIIRKSKAEIEALKEQMSNMDYKSSIAEVASIDQSITNAKDKIVQKEAENVRLQEQIDENSENFENFQKIQERIREKQKLRTIPPVSKRYITQSEVTGTRPDQQEGDLPVSFVPMPISSKATAGPDTDDPASAVMLGAVELNLSTLADLVQTQIQVRGDPYWLGKPKSAHNVLNPNSNRDGRRGAPYDLGGCSYFLNMNFPVYPDEQTGLMNIPESNFGIVGLYRVYRVVANYADGQFNMTLEAFRDNSTNIGLVWDEISSGFIDIDAIKQEDSFKQQELEEETLEDQPEEENPGSNLGIVEDGDANGTVTESQASVAGVRKLAIASDLKQILQTAGQRAGVNVDVRSGGQDSSTGFTGSDRHNNGHAADVALTLADGTRLNANNPQHLPIIKNFIAEAKAAGATGIGAGNGYMGDNTFHIDNASLYGQGSAGYWGGQLEDGTFRSKNAPQWLRDIMTG